MKSGILNFLEPSGPLQACNGTALPLPYITTCLAVPCCCCHNIVRARFSGKMYDHLITWLWRRAEETDMSTQIKRRKWNWIGHTLRKGDEGIEREASDWNPQGKRRGRPRHTWRKSVHNEALEKGKSWSEVKRMAGNRTRWRCLVDALCTLRDNRNWWGWWLD